MNSLVSSPPGRRRAVRGPSGRRSRAARTGWLALLAGLLAACSVTHAPIDAHSDPAALPNLRRASEALQERIAREKEHVTGLNRQLADLLASEAQVYAEVFEAEGTFQRLRADADAARADVTAVEAELAQVRQKLASRAIERDAARLELEGLQAELEVQRLAGLAARREIDFWRGGLDAGGEVPALRRARLEEFRRRWDIPPDKWASLMGDLGLTAVLMDPPAPAAAAPPQPAPPDDSPAPSPDDGGSEDEPGSR